MKKNLAIVSLSLLTIFSMFFSYTKQKQVIEYRKIIAEKDKELFQVISLIQESKAKCEQKLSYLELKLKTLQASDSQTKK